ncbi:MAG TPA: spore germination protein GerW family protein [Solirubrobacteraceae bacterium]|jgi:hypothetical protein|nr:spore germination protein GerW family protein [Solirubrobacteraceae bacterium]
MSKPRADRQGPRVGGLRRLLDRLAGARLCYGEPVVARDRTVIPVARVRLSGGGGWGSGGSQEGDGAGGGGGGHLDATPVGFIEVDDAGARYHEIPDPDRPARMLRAGAGALATLATAAAAARRLRTGERRGRRSLSRGG